jgi:hypothetical protein
MPEPDAMPRVTVQGGTGDFKCLTPSTSSPARSGAFFVWSTHLLALEPIRKVWIHDEGFATSRFSMMRIMARRMKAATVPA